MTAVNREQKSIPLFYLICGVSIEGAWLRHELATYRTFTTIPGQPGSSQNLLKLGGCSGIEKIIQVIHLKTSC